MKSFLRPFWFINMRFLRPFWFINMRFLRPFWFISAMLAALFLAGIVVGIIGLAPQVTNVLI
ncbi:MAG: hypothetical protein HeimAB125_22400 [Candidatus Heimdallarchaeota archaeon AB_125]|nr:MAG: hypothetical protein HeimAB125_22400 [Candidatus Heimdallarchaeota archaeon AB_125]